MHGSDPAGQLLPINLLHMVLFHDHCLFTMKSGIIDSLKKGGKDEDLPLDV